MLLSIALLLLASAADAFVDLRAVLARRQAFAQLGDSRAPIPNLETISKGVNFLTVNQDDGISRASTVPIIDLSATMAATPDNRWTIPDNTLVNIDGSCSSDTRAAETTGIEEHRKTVTAGVTISPAGAIPLTGAFSASVSKAAERYTKEDSQAWRAQGMCDWFHVTWKQPTKLLPSDDMTYQLQKLNSNPTTANWNTLFDKFGTHYWSKLTLGGIVSQDSTISTEGATLLGADDVDTATQVKASLDYSLGLSSKALVETQGYELWKQHTTSGSIDSKGGDWDRSGNYFDWVTSIADKPEPIGGDLRPLSDLLDQWAPNLSKGYDDALMAWFLGKISGSTTPVPDLLPCIAGPRVGQKGKFTNEATATCAGKGEIALGGGCSTYPGDKADFVDQKSCDGSPKGPCENGSWPWLFHASKPKDNNGWLCHAGEDYGSYVYDRQVSSTAVCAQAEVPILGGTVRLDTKTADCVFDKVGPDTSDGRLGNSCTAECPTGWIITGGGCWTDGSSTGEDHPWRITVNRPTEDNEWECKMAQDYGMGNQHEQVRGQAVCARWSHDIAGLPKIPRAHKIVTTESGKGAAHGAVAVLQCPQGYFLVGGGGAAGEVEGKNPNFDWRLSAFAPMAGSGWVTVGAEDYRSGTQKQSVTAYGICVALF